MRIGFTPAERIQIAVAIASRAVALATLVLAAVTIYMARETKRVAQATEDEAEKVANQASSTKEQASISAASLRASIRPWLTKSESAQAAHVEVQSTNHLVVSLRILNVGPGVALIPPDGCIIEGGGVQPGSIVRREGQVDKPVLSRGRDATVAFDVEGKDIEVERFLDQPDTKGQFRVSITYTDANGGQGMRADIHIAAGGSTTDAWIFDTLEYVYAPGDSSEERSGRGEVPQLAPRSRIALSARKAGPPDPRPPSRSAARSVRRRGPSGETYPSEGPCPRGESSVTRRAHVTSRKYEVLLGVSSNEPYRREGDSRAQCRNGPQTTAAAANQR
jgi:hypothetical protein